ncbi:MAG TPA: nuclear transport factor 2 family protein [Candidatus Limnocylindrales bacterium]|nr:nuclear transport factor 2 family protein [Candidatus Limnocylindrales bacterium]
MAAADAVDDLIEQFRRAQNEFLKGNPGPVKDLFSRRDDVTVANPYGPPVRGWENVARVIEQASSQRRDGELVAVETITKFRTDDLAYVVGIERAKAKIGRRDDVGPYALRATMIFRLEDGTWKIVLRHADPITTAQGAESVIR